MAKVDLVEKFGVEENEIQAALALMAKNREQRAKQREKANDPVKKEHMKELNNRSRVRRVLMLEKATAAGIVITPEEVDAYIAANA